MVAICGLCGGAGTSTLAYTLAAAAAERSTQPVFACETSGITGGLALYARAQPGLSLTQAANQLATGTPPAGLVVSSPERGPRSRLAARAGRAMQPRRGGAVSWPRPGRPAGLVVLDCGTAAHAVDRDVLAVATHVLWVIPATASGVARAGPALKLLGEFVHGRQALVARLDRNEHAMAVSRLADLAGALGARADPVPACGRHRAGARRGGDRRGPGGARGDRRGAP